MKQTNSETQAPAFHWPDGKRAAVSLTFDDARLTQADVGLPVLDACGAKATFYVSVAGVEQRLPEWKAAVATGHEIGNHTLTHPCSGNFDFTRDRALEDYTLERMEAELTDANDAIERLLGVRPTTFAYPCGQTFVGRGEGFRGYVPLVAKHFDVGRRAFDEIPNDPVRCDLAHATGMELDGITWEQFEKLIGLTVAEGRWLILLAHEVGQGPRQTVSPEMLRRVCEYCLDDTRGIWLDTVAAIGRHVRRARQ